MSLLLGIDVGTTSLKVSCVQVKKRDEGKSLAGSYKVLQRVSLAYHQHLKSNEFTCLNKDHLDAQQDALLITGECNAFLVLSTLVTCLHQLDGQLRRRVDAIAICGQMHGILFYGEESLRQIRSVQADGSLELNLNFCRDDRNRISNCFTWEDRRCDKAFLDQLPSNADFENRLTFTGYATATTFWFLKNDPEYLKNFRFMGSLMDLFVHLVCPDLEHPVTSNQLANSFGYFDMKTNNWSNFLYDSQFPAHLLPTVLDDHQMAGRLRHRFLEVKQGCPVFAACGDLQCAIYSAMFGKDRAAILNSGTSMQLAFPLSRTDLREIRSASLLKLFASKVDLPVDESTPTVDQTANECVHLEVVPYFADRYLVTSNSLNGGNVIVFFIKSIHKFVADLFGGEVSEDQIWPKISSLAKKYLEKKKASPDGKGDDIPIIVPRLYGERYEEIKSKFSISSISADNFELGKLYYSLCSGVLANIFDGMCPIELLQQLGIGQLVAVGSTITNNEIMRLCLEEKLNKAKLKLVYENDAEADVGVCLWIAEQLKSE